MDESMDDKFWTDPDEVAEAFDRRFEDGEPFLAVIGPTRFDPSLHEDLPIQLAQAGRVRDFVERNLLRNGRIVLVDLDRNSVRICDVDVPQGEQPDRPPVKPPDLDAPQVGMQSIQLDLCTDRFPELHEEIGRYRLMAILPHVQTDPIDFKVGPDEPAFGKALRESLAEMPRRNAVPESIFAENKPWKAVAMPQGLPEGIALELGVEGERLHAAVSTAIQEMPNERLVLEPGAILPNGTRPPDALRRLHLVALSDRSAYAISLEVPVNGDASGGLLRGCVSIDLERAFPGWRKAELRSLRVFCGSWMAGPVSFPGIP
ncbi:MAG TPA: hypothetical protein PKO15_01400 [Fibrobacteria bacterium]|nr:hypothetical protein [Fibrobacteria bacterium]